MANSIYPYYHDYKFGDNEDQSLTEGDSRLNSFMLRAALDVVKPKFINGKWEGGNWKVIIKDQHLDEEEPHYILSFGSNPCPTGFVGPTSYSLRLPYVDNHSTTNEKGERIIEQAPGYATITVFGTGHDASSQEFANIMARAYIEGLAKFFPDYFILVDESDIVD